MMATFRLLRKATIRSRSVNNSSSIKRQWALISSTRLLIVARGTRDDDDSISTLNRDICPVDKPREVRIEVTWTLNETIWLKIEDGEKKIYNRLTTFSKRIVAGEL
ncbi:hypothetical protein ANCDUO_13156 [Ancylostoma duodenale]|uniref:Uncharacterized protein n=1 Tax=Ancylostoma duodenale TaxID=51022 RepID=A0A0C2D3M3_9BILA|nr:hypothetical protein ANCDUO_13156 [Ancylostoma duodenale]